MMNCRVVPQGAQAKVSSQLAPRSAPTTDAIAPPLQSADLFNGEKVVQIAHHGEIYRLQTTKLGKLILTK